MMKRARPSLVIAMVLSLTGLELAASPAANLVANPSFEDGSPQSSLGPWQVSAAKPTATVTDPSPSAEMAALVNDANLARSGQRCLRIVNPSAARVGVSAPLPAMKPGAIYELAVWARGKEGTKIQMGPEWFIIDGTWQRYSALVYSEPGAKRGAAPALRISVVGAAERNSSGAAEVYIDDASVTEIDCGLADAFGDHMVLQRGKPVRLWGWDRNAGQKVAVAFAGQTKTATADPAGWWQVTLDAMPAGGPHVLSLNGRPAAADVLVGDVWLCSGQSNMDFGLDKVNGVSNTAPAALAEANHPNIRLWRAGRQIADRPMRSYLARQGGLGGTWQCRWSPCTPIRAGTGGWGGFSAVGYYFGRELQKADPNVPIGLVQVAKGGTPLEAWISAEAVAGLKGVPMISPPLETSGNALLDAMPKLDPNAAVSAACGEVLARLRSNDAQEFARLLSDKKTGARFGPDMRCPSTCFDALLAPMTPLAIRGAVWYQGENNANGFDRRYDDKLKALVADWRKQFNDPALAVLIVQLPNWRSMSARAQADIRWQLTREAQARVAADDPRCGLVVTLDLADPNEPAHEIHPRVKEPIGVRLALLARAMAGEKIVSSGPTYKAMKIDADKVRLSFDSVGGGVVAKGGELAGFAIAGADRNFVPASAFIDGDGVVVSSPQVSQPAAVRYNFDSFVENVGNLYNKEGLPAGPFRTDDWPVDGPVLGQ